MKKIMICVISISFFAIAHAKSPFKERVKKLEKDVNTLAKKEKRAWHELDQLNNKVSQLEDEALLEQYRNSYQNSYRMNQGIFGQDIQEEMIEKKGNNHVLIIDSSMLE